MLGKFGANEMFRFNDVEVLFAGGRGQPDEYLLGGLAQTGFRKISHVRTSSELKWLLSQERPDLFILNSTNRNRYIYSYCQQLRQNLSGGNPFATVLSWNRRPSESEVKVAVECGVDGLITHSPSTRSIISQISQFIWKRKDFVVSGDYIGPDRRIGWSLVDGRKTTVVRAPNSLRAKATGDNFAVLNLEKDILSSVAIIKNLKLAERIETIKYLGTTINLICREPTYTSAIENHLRILVKNVAEIPSYLSDARYHHIKSLCIDINENLMGLGNCVLESNSPAIVGINNLCDSLTMVSCAKPVK